MPKANQSSASVAKIQTWRSGRSKTKPTFALIRRALQEIMTDYKRGTYAAAGIIALLAAEVALASCPAA